MHMHINTKDLLNSIMESFDRISYVRSSDIPNIDLYMDQVTTFIDGLDVKLPVLVKKLFRDRSQQRLDIADRQDTFVIVNEYQNQNVFP